jgi:hypothetical protein
LNSKQQITAEKNLKCGFGLKMPFYKNKLTIELKVVDIDYILAGILEKIGLSFELCFFYGTSLKLRK